METTRDHRGDPELILEVSCYRKLVVSAEFLAHGHN